MKTDLTQCIDPERGSGLEPIEFMITVPTSESKFKQSIDAVVLKGDPDDFDEFFEGIKDFLQNNQ